MRIKTKKQETDLRAYKEQFYRGNKLCFAIAFGEVLLEVACTLVLSWLIQQLLDLNSGNNSQFTIIELAVIAITLILVSIIGGMIAYYTKPKFITRGISQYKEFVFKELTKKKISAFTEEDTATYISALTNDIQTIEQGYLGNIFTVAESLLTFLGALVLMIWYSPMLTAIAVVLSMLPLIASIISGNKVAEAEKLVSDQNKEYTSTIRDSLSGFSVIKSFKAESQMIGLFKLNITKLSNAQCTKQKRMIIVHMLGTVAGVTAQLGVFIFGVYLALSGKEITAGTTMVFVQLMSFVISPIVTIPTCLAERKSAKALICKIANALNNNVREAAEDGQIVLNRGIEIKNLSFGYDEEKEVLKNINYTFELGKKYAIVGASGSGKSTLLNLLMASYQNYKGAICYDETELHDIHSDTLYDIESIIQQNVFVFNASIKDNITMFRDFPEEEIDRAISLSGLSDFIVKKGADYLCGENGSGLSGGEKQRISIARSLLKKSQILLVDEATAALDPETAFQVSSSILGLNDITCIVVTHTLDASLLSQYDEILTFKNGTIVEEGTFDDLLEKKGYFYSLYTVSQ